MKLWELQRGQRFRYIHPAEHAGATGFMYIGMFAKTDGKMANVILDGCEDVSFLPADLDVEVLNG